MHKIISLFTISFLCLSASAGEVVFEGYPTKKVEVTEQASDTYELSNSQSSEYKVIIMREGDKYYWSTRNNIQLVPTRSGIYITFIAVNGAGYVRTLEEELQELFKMMPEEEQKKQYLYIEHLIHQLGSITYYGR
ncbi:MAG: hypothetical protein GTN99_01530 [Candidatus Dadabacteria bacterium]|nr:hypothetical protein [Candidatus Dadabacteria bacterium]